MVKEINDSGLAEAIGNGYVVLDVFGDHCGPCRYMEPFFEQVSSELAYISFLKISCDRNPDTQKLYNVHAVPTLLFLKDGEVKARVTGALDADGLKKKIAEFLYEM